MDFFNKALAQAADLFRSMTPATRLTTFGLFAVLTVSLVFLFRHGVSSSDSYLFGGAVLDQDEIWRLEGAFSQAGLSGWEVDGNRVRVPSGRRHEFIAAAADGNALPKNFDIILEESIKDGSPFESGQMREQKMKATLERMLAEMCNDMQGIEKARVTISEERGSGLVRKGKKFAVVAAQAERENQLTEQQVECLRNTIAAGVGTEPVNVTVTDFRGPSYPGTTAPGFGGANDFASAKAKLEAHYKEKIQTHLAYIPGAIAEVNVELNPRVNLKTQTQTYNEPQPVRTSSSKIESTTRSGSGGGRPGAVPNGVIGNRAEEIAATSSSEGESKNTEVREESEQKIGQEITEFIEPGFTPKDVFAAIQIPKNHFLMIWRNAHVNDTNPPKQPDPTEMQKIETDEMKRIQDTLVNLLPPLTAGKDRRPLVTVTSYEMAEAPVPEEPGVSTVIGQFLLQNWRTLGMGLLAVVSLFFVRSIVRGGQRALAAAAPLPTPVPVPELARSRAEPLDEASAPSAAAAQPAAKVLKRKFGASGPNLRDELAELVREDPDAAAAIISNWIGDAV